MRVLTICALSLAATFATLTPPASAGELVKTYDFELDAWHDIEDSDGPVTLHRVRLDRQEGRVTKSALARPFNQEYLATVQVVLEYTNEASAPWKSRLTARWLDRDGRVIDGISANEKLEKKAARKVNRVSVSTLQYGLERAKSLEISVHYQP